MLGEEKTAGSREVREVPEEKNAPKGYKEKFDDPYKVLSYSLVVNYPPVTVKRLMKDTKFLRREIIREVRGQDFRGYFTDCLFVSICEEKKRMDLMRQMDVLARFLYQNLDLNRMRAEIRSAYESLGLGDLLEEPKE